mgnify:CR=1 FL=1|jgi:hypothetical protein
MIFILNVFLSVFVNDKIDEINKLTSLAEKSFLDKNYTESIRNYKTLIDSLDYSNEKIFLNLAHAHLLSTDTLNAIENYNLASLTDNKKVKSIALQQLGNINEKNNKLDEALRFYKESIIADNNNNDSKFNYELVKKRLEQEKKQEQENKKDNKEDSQKNQNKNQSENKKQDKEGKEEKNKENKDQEEKKKNDNSKNDQKKSKEESVEEKLKKINMTKKKAEMILNALNNNEFQYIQQLKRKPSKKKDKSKPDW